MYVCMYVCMYVYMYVCTIFYRNAKSNKSSLFMYACFCNDVVACYVVMGRGGWARGLGQGCHAWAGLGRACGGRGGGLQLCGRVVML